MGSGIIEPTPPEMPLLLKPRGSELGVPAVDLSSITRATYS